MSATISSLSGRSCVLRLPEIVWFMPDRLFARDRCLVFVFSPPASPGRRGKSVSGLPDFGLTTESRRPREKVFAFSGIVRWSFVRKEILEEAFGGTQTSNSSLNRLPDAWEAGMDSLRGYDPSATSVSSSERRKLGASDLGKDLSNFIGP